MKDSIKREQSQAGLSFAERENFRPKVKRNKLLLLLALLLTAATGAWADEVTEIVFTGTVMENALAADATFTVDGSTFSATIADDGNKMRIDADACRFGTSTSYKSYTHRLCSGGKSSSTKNYITLNIPEAGKLRIAPRTGSNSATDRKLEITQGGTELYNEIVQESQAVTVTESGQNVTVYPYVEVDVTAGSVRVSYTGGLNFYSFGFVAASSGGGSGDGWTDIIVNGNLEGTDRQCFFVKENALGSENVYYARIQDGSGKDGSRGIVLQSTGEEANAWDTQFFLRLPYELPAGTKYRLKFDYKADNACKCDLQAQNEPGEYIIYYIDNAQGSPACNFGTDWATYDSGEITVPADCDGSENAGGFLNKFQTISFNLSQNQKATTYYIDNIKLEILTADLSKLTESPAPKALPQYPVEINSIAIMGDFLGKGDDGNWNTANAWALTQDATNNKVWTLTKEFTAEAKTYDYKLFANGNMSDFTYPVEEKAKGQFVVSQAGQYNLNITASLEYNVVSVYAVPASLSVKMKDGTVDAGNWSIASGEKSATGDAADGLTGLSEGQTVTLTYTGRLKVKGVKATSDAAAPSVPDGALSGVFSLSDTKQVNFSKGNLQLVGENTIQFAENQWDYFGDKQSDNHRDLFCWGTGNNPNQTTGNSTFTDWGDNTYLQATLGKGWRTMTKDEFVYVFNTRASGSSVFGIANGRYTTATINTDGTGVNGFILFPDGITIAASEVTTAGTINNKGTVTQCTTAQWAALAKKGCVFLPAGGYFLTNGGAGYGSITDYWSSTAANASKAFNLNFNFGYPQGGVNPASSLGYNYGCSVRLVREVAASDAPAKTPATVTTAPTATTGDIVAGSETALVSGGAATGGTMMYAVTTTNAKPTSTEGFSDAVPTAETLAAGTYYVWYYVKGDDSHTDSEISATAIEVTVKAATITVTINQSDWGGWDTPITKDGVTVSAHMIDPMDGNLMQGGTFSTTLGNFTKIEVTCEGCEATGTGWNSGRSSQTWAGTPASTVSFSGNFMGQGSGITIVCTIVPKPTN